MKNKSIFGYFRLFTVALSAISVIACTGEEIKPEENLAAAPREKSLVLRTGYTCCNLHYEGDAVSDSNLAQLAFIPAGTPIRVREIDGYRVSVEINGKLMHFGLDFGRGQETTEQWINKVVVVDDPKLKIAKFSPTVRKAIEAGKLMKGMTKEQVIMAVGYPQKNENPKLDGLHWRYWWSSFGPYYVYWSGNQVKKIDGHSETVASMTYKGK